MSPRRNNFASITSQPEVKSSTKSCCGSRKMVKDKPDISPDVNSQTEMDGPEDQVVQVQEIDIAAAPIFAIQADKERSTCCGKNVSHLSSVTHASNVDSE